MRRCTGKRRHETKDEAITARKALVASGKVRMTDSRVLPRCDQCGGWHVGGSAKNRGGRGRDGRR
jgi:hypothetical protein